MFTSARAGQNLNLNTNQKYRHTQLLAKRNIGNPKMLISDAKPQSASFNASSMFNLSKGFFSYATAKASSHLTSSRSLQQINMNAATAVPETETVKEVDDMPKVEDVSNKNEEKAEEKEVKKPKAKKEEEKTEEKEGEKVEAKKAAPKKKVIGKKESDLIREYILKMH